MRKPSLSILVAGILTLAGIPSTSVSAQQSSIVNSPHNLSASGPGNIRAIAEQEVCIFCHTPHHASLVRPLWNRTLSTSAYTPYRSSSLKAQPGQPTGSSKLCLSCHDGTIALGSVLSRSQQITMSNGVIELPPGRANLGTNLSDDHPISFAYDQALLQKKPSLKDPSGLPAAVKLDANHEVQCISCHEPHNNQFGKFLVMDNTASMLCKACHDQGTTVITAHSDCASCHQPHTSPSGPYLLRGKTVTETCNASGCHGAQASQPRLNIASDITKPSHHDTNSAVDQPNHAPDNTVCTDCHEAHTMGSGSSIGAPAISPRLGKVSGINAQGTAVTPAQYEYQICFKCHGDNPTTLVTPIPRRIVQPNTRLQFASNAVSFHPVEVAGKNSYVPSLLPGLTTSSIIFCTDCHASNSSPAANGSGARGPHGSTNQPLLVANYTTADGTPESAMAYALCYKCHDRNAFASEAPFGASTPFKPHFKHIHEQNTPCSACHDSHGIAQAQGTANNQHLINFDTSIVRPLPNGKLEWVASGINQGTCSLICHGKTHDGLSYGGAAAALIRRSVSPPPTMAKPGPTKRR